MKAVCSLNRVHRNSRQPEKIPLNLLILEGPEKGKPKKQWGLFSGSDVVVPGKMASDLINLYL
jgi:hypothetical protein